MPKYTSLLLWIFIILFIKPSHSLAAVISNLEDAVASLSEQMKPSDAQIEAADAERKAALGNFLPNVRLEASVQHLDRDLLLDLDGIRSAILQVQAADAVQFQNLSSILQGLGPLSEAQQAQVQALALSQYDAAIPHFIDTIKPQTYWLGSIQAYQPLFHGGRIRAGYLAAEAKLSSVKAEADQQRQALEKDLIKWYIQALLLQSSIPLREQAVKALENHVRKAHAFQAEGLVDRTASLKAELALADAKSQLSDDQSKLETIYVLLEQLTHQKLAKPLQGLLLSTPAKYISQYNISLHPTLRLIESKKQLATQSYHAQRASFVPEIGAFGKLELHQSVLSALEPNWVIGVKASMNLFRGGADYHSVAQSRATIAQVEALEENARESLVAHRKRSQIALEQSKVKYEALSHRISLAEENSRITGLRFDQGLATSLDVVDAHLGLEKSQVEQLQASADAWIALLELRWLEGNTQTFLSQWKERNP